MKKFEEKAKELIEKFRKDARLESNGFGATSESDYLNHAKQCALICINEILLTNPTIKGNSDDLITMIVQTKAYYQQVIEAINKM